MDATTNHFLHITKISDVKEKRSSLISLKSDEAITTALQILAQGQITGAPVIDINSQQYIGFVDVLDLAMFVANVFAENYKKHPHLYDPRELERVFNLPVSQVINASNRDPFIPVDINESISYLINNFLKFGVHRVPVQQKGEIVNIVSQSDVVRFLHKHNAIIKDETNKTLTELGLDKGNVISITNDETLIKAFIHIVTHKISAIAVVDFQTGQLLNNLSASDLKGITQETFWRLEQPIHQILLHLGPNKLPPVVCTVNTKMGEVIELFCKHGVHRIYVLNPERKPINVITLTDVLNVFATPFHVISK
jgi:predicted transcriptional regulator